MKRTLSLLAATLLVLSLAPAAHATDGLGVYIDQAGTTNCSAAPAPYSAVTLYLVAKNVSAPSGISGWECALVFDPPTFSFPPTYTILNGGLNVFTAPNFQVGLAAPVPFAEAMSLASISILYMGGSLKVGMGPCTPSSFGSGAYPDVPPGPGYALGDNPGELRRLYPSSNVDSGTPLHYWVYYLGVDEPCPGSPVGLEENSWGGVKNLFK